jgi:curved DNA-binding protein CbpA
MSMTDPFEILGVSHQASEAEVRRRYLELVREFPPDRAPEKFAEIRAAFDAVRDPLARFERQLFSLHSDASLAGLAGEIRKRLRNARLSVDALLALAEPR